MAKRALGMRRGAALAACLAWLVALSMAAVGAPCTKLPDLWFPDPGVILSGGDVAVQVANPVVVMQGDTVTVTVTVDNFTCGETGPFDVSLYYDTVSAGTLIATQSTSLLGCEHAVLTFVWDTTGVPAGSHDLIAWADSGQIVDEYKEDDNQYTLTVTVLAAPVIEVDKTFVDADGACVEPDDLLQIRITIMNVGDGDHGATLALVDVLPVGLDYVPGTAAATSGTTGYDPVANAVTWTGALPALSQALITFEVEVNGGVPIPSDLPNQAVADWDPDQDGVNNATEPSDDPTTPAVDDPTVIPVRLCLLPIGPDIPGTIDAPSLTEWGMIAFGVTIVCAFTLMLLRRRRLLAALAERGSGT